MTFIIYLFVSVLVATTAFAQNTLSMELPEKEITHASRGVRVAYLKPILNYEQNFSKLGKFAGHVDDSFDGISVGYADLPIQNIGWSANAAYLEVKPNGIVTNLARVDGNVAYAVNQIFSGRVGLNATNFTRGKSTGHVDIGIGGQAAVGVQFTENIGMDFGYTVMRMSGSSRVPTPLGVIEDTYDYTLSGLEMGLTGTF